LDLAFLNTVVDTDFEFLSDVPFGTVRFHVGTLVLTAMDDGLQRYPCRLPAHGKKYHTVDGLPVTYSLHLEVPPM
jgi:hypothetical protein